MINRYEVNFDSRMVDFSYRKSKAIQFAIKIAEQAKGNLYQTVVINKYRGRKYLGCFICRKIKKNRTFTFEYQEK